ncbi:MAG TPA: GTP 3',8-cyclase MoaA [Xanthomonadales bacterium]|nr:GTP 3',8-cyclase MoaA [Xanthomonadales bacterium]
MQVPIQITETTPARWARVNDQLQRPLRELRLSVIDRCNFRCTYCMPADSLQGRGVFLPLANLLTDREIVTLVTAFVANGVKKLRITGGEPLVRPGLPALIEKLSVIDGLDDIAMTTNGVLLPRHAVDLHNAGLRRITVSLDSLDEAVLHLMSGGKGKLAEILDGINAAVAAGFTHLKINCVVQRGVNDHTVLDLLEHFRGSGHSVRLIEYMDVGNSNHWELSQVVPSAEWVERIAARWPIEPVGAQRASETAKRYRYIDGSGDGADEIGLISSISQPFCGGCTRARLTADGMFYTCLFATTGKNMMPLLRQAQNSGQLAELINQTWQQRTDRYSEERSQLGASREKVEMYRIGG